MARRNSRRPDSFALISIGAKSINPHIVSEAYKTTLEMGSNIEVLLLDSTEAINILILSDSTTEKANHKARVQAHNYRARLYTRHPFINISLLSDYQKRHDFLSLVASVERLYFENKSFQNHCHNQIFRNLHPRLKGVGARNSRSEVVRKLYKYLVIELALLIYLHNQGNYKRHYSLNQEMDIWNDIRIGKYGSLIDKSKEPFQFHMLCVNQTSSACLEANAINPQINHPPERTNLSYSFNISKITSLIGPSGSGKTTLLSAIAGHIPLAHSSNSDSYLQVGQGNNVRRLDGKSPFKRDVATVFQEFALFPQLTCIDNVVQGSNRHGYLSRSEKREIALSYMSLLDVNSCSDKYPNDISGGEKQRVAIARALISCPLILLMDEPTASIDFIQRRQLAILFQQDLFDLSSMIVLIASHDREFAFSISNNIMIIDRGTIIQVGSTFEILSSPRSERIAEILGSHIKIRTTKVKLDLVSVLSTFIQLTMNVSMSNDMYSYALVPVGSLFILPSSLSPNYPYPILATISHITNIGFSFLIVLSIDGSDSHELCIKGSKLSKSFDLLPSVGDEVLLLTDADPSGIVLI
jgi:iron(III) transport system ATP-binding protein